MHDHCDEHIHDHHNHDMEHAHEGIHAHEHAHAHAEEHHHPHDHEHTHVHTHEHTHGDAGAQPMEQLYALMKYMAGHNADHTRELEGLAGKAKEAGAAEAYDLIMEAVHFFDQGNESLGKALEEFPHN